MKEFSVSVPNPCHEDWDKMQAKGNGRHCDSCNKIVVDFSKMSNDEILLYLKINKDIKVCGTFKSSQVENNTPSTHQFLNNLYQYIENKFLIKALRPSLLFAIGLMMTVMGCQNRTTGEPVLPDDKKLPADSVQLDSVQIESINLNGSSGVLITGIVMPTIPNSKE